MSPAHRLPTHRIRLLVAGVLLWSAIVLAPISGSARSAAASARIHRGPLASVSKRRTRRAACTATTRRRHTDRHRRKAARSCAKPGGGLDVGADLAPAAGPAETPAGLAPQAQLGGLVPASPPAPAHELAPGPAPAPAPEPVPSPELGSGGAGGEATGGEATEEASPSAETTSLVESSPHFRFFSSTGIWNTSVTSGVQLDPNSSSLMSAFAQEVSMEAANNELNINTTAWSVPVYTVPAGQPTVKVLLNKPNSSLNPLQTAWDAVPLPANAQPAKGTDKQLVVWQPSTDKLWEFWAFENTLSGPVAQWGGAIEKASEDSGVYSAAAWPSAQTSWGASGTSLSIAGGLITLEDLEKGQINHALAMAIPHPRALVWSSPAQRTDGVSTEPLSLPEGAHLRLDPKLKLSTLHLPKLILMIAEAAQRYGIYVRDRGGNIAFYAQDPTPTGTNPYTGPEGYFEGKCACKLLTSFPWSHLQLLKMELHPSG